MNNDLLSLLKVTIEGEMPSFARFVFEPLPTGFGHTLGNALRRVLLSSLPGAAVTQLKIEGVNHQFSTIPGMREDIVEVCLNTKKIRIKIHDDNPVTLKLEVKGPKEVKAGDLEILGNGEIVNKDLYLFSLSDNKSKVSLEMIAERGFGYVTSEEKEISKIGVIPVDSIFTPVTAVAYKVEAARLGRRTNLDRLILEVTTDGTVPAQEALKFSSRLLVEYFQMVSGDKVNDFSHENDKVAPAKTELSAEERSTPLEDLGLSTRTTNALMKGKIHTLGELSGLDAEKLGKVRGLGEKGLTEIEKLLKRQD